MKCQLAHPEGCMRHEIHTPGPLVIACLIFEDPSSPSGWSAHVEGFGTIPAGRRTAEMLRVAADAHERRHGASNS